MRKKTKVRKNRQEVKRIVSTSKEVILRDLFKKVQGRPLYSMEIRNYVIKKIFEITKGKKLFSKKIQYKPDKCEVDKNKYEDFLRSKRMLTKKIKITKSRKVNFGIIEH